MKRAGFIGTAVLLLLVGTVALVYAQQDQQDVKQRETEEQGKPEKQQAEKQARPEQQRHVQQDQDEQQQPL